MITDLINYLSGFISISQALEEKIKSIAISTSFPKGSRVINAGGRCDKLFFINKGLMRGYYVSDGKEITTWFARESEFATCFYSFIAQKPSVEIIETLEDCELLFLPYHSLQELYRSFPETEHVGRIITENYYIKLEERILCLQFKTAGERYQNLFLNKPFLLQRASLGQIASYLGITQETLSRIRAEK